MDEKATIQWWLIMIAWHSLVDFAIWHLPLRPSVIISFLGEMVNDIFTFWKYIMTMTIPISLLLGYILFLI